MSWSARLKTPTKPTGTVPKTASSRNVTPGRGHDENSKPLSTPRAGRSNVASSILNKKLRDETTSSSCESLGPGGTPRTPLSAANRNKTPVGRKTPTAKVAGGSKAATNGTPKSSTKQRTPTKTTPRRDRAERSVLVEFSDDIFVTPGQLPTAGNPGTPTSVSVKTSSMISFHNTPLAPLRNSSPHSSLNRSLSASSLSHHSRSSEGGNPLLRSQSEAKLYGIGEGAHLPCDSGESSRVTVGVRVRPLHHREAGNTVFVTGNEIRVASDLGSVHRFSYDQCFPTSSDLSTQEEVYDTLVRPLVDTAFQGYNACLFAYGQTGSGKTYSMMGPMHANCGLTPESGIIPRFCREVLERASALDQSGTDQAKSGSSSVTTSVEISYLEVYNEKIHDLLAPGMDQLKVREHPVYGPYVVDLSKHTTSTYNELQHWIDMGNQKRATAATEMNDKSSRSHSLFTVILTQTFAQVGSDGNWSHDQTRRSQINLVDLAGSERIAHSSVTSDRLREGVSINKSLLTLGKVMAALIEKRPHVPYRDSVLTWLLKESLGGNSRTTMLATISPSSAHIDETLSTLRYASQARSIINTVRVNEAPQDKLIRELRAEIERLRQQESDRGGVFRPLTDSSQETAAHSEVKRLQEQLEEKTKGLQEAENLVTVINCEKKTLESKLNEYIENNRQLASKMAAEKTDKQSTLTAREIEMKAMVDELVTLREQHKSLKQHYLKSQDELEFERGAKYQVMSEKEKDAGEIASLKTRISKLENDLLMEKNESVLKDSEIKKLKSEIKEMQLAQENLTTTFVLKEEFCHAQALAEIEKEEVLTSKNREIADLSQKVQNMLANLKSIGEVLSSMSFLKEKTRMSSISDPENLAPLMKKVKEHVDFLGTTNQLLKQQLENGAKNVEEKDNEIVKLKDRVKTLESNGSMKPKYKKLQKEMAELVKKNEHLEDEKVSLTSKLADLESEVAKWRGDVGHINEQLEKSKTCVGEWKRKCDEANEYSGLTSQGHMKELLRLQEELQAANKSLAKMMESEAELQTKYDKCSALCSALESSKTRTVEEKAKIESNFKALEKSFRNLQNELKAAEEKLEVTKKSESSSKLVLEELLQKQGQSDELQKENENLQTLVKSLNQDLDQMKIDLVSARDNSEKFKSEILEACKDIEEKDAVIKKLEEKCLVAEEALKVCSEEKIKLDRLSNELKIKIDALESEKAVSSKQSSELEALKTQIGNVQNAMSKLSLAEKELEALKIENKALKAENDSLKKSIEEMKRQIETSSKNVVSTVEMEKLKTEVQALQERNKYMKKKIRKSKLFDNNNDTRKLKTEITQLKRVNQDVASELEKVRAMKLGGSPGDSSTLKVELKSVRAEMERVEQMKSSLDGLLQNAKQELESASEEMKVLKSENATLEKRASKAVFENESLRDQVAKLEKEKAEILDKINTISGEKSVTDYKLRMSLVATKSIEDKEEEVKKMQEKYDACREESDQLKKKAADLEHQLSLCKLNEDTLKSDLSAKVTLLGGLQNEIKAAQQMQRELMEEKLALVKVMEKHFNDESLDARNGVMAENASLKKELRMCQQRLENKCEKSAALNKRVSELENLLVKVIDDKIRGQLQLEDLRAALVNKDYNAFDIVMGLYLPHHLEYLVRRARTLSENYKIPYDIDLLSEERKILFKHLILKAVVVLNRTLLDKWIEKIEEQKGWSKSDDKELPWKVDFDSYLSQEDVKMVESPPEADSKPSVDNSAISLGIRKKADGSLDPVEWRRTLIQRHVRGMKDDYQVLIKYFGAEEDSAIYAILERIRAAVDRLEHVTASIALDSLKNVPFPGAMCGDGIVK